jgi:branched-chain amino acid transport system substrate-binding protein
MLKKLRNWLALFVMGFAAAGGALAQGKGGNATTVRIAFMDPLSGPFAAVGQNQLKHFQYAAEIANQRQLAGPNVRFEIVPFDNKNSPQESLTLLRTIIDQKINFVAQGNGSHVAIPLADAIAKHNERNPEQAIVYLNYAAVDPDLTNSKCNFWHFRFDANTDMKMEALTSYIKDRPEVKNVYLLNQNYSHGQQVARVAKELLARKRPDVKIVGEDLHPLGQVRDFSPYIAKIRAANADTVITGNWGTDLTLLIRAARDAGLNVNFYTYYAGVTGTPTAMGAAGAERVRQVSYWHPNIDKFPGEELYKGFKAKFNDEWYGLATFNAVAMVAEAIKRNKGNADPLRVAHTLSGMRYTGIMGDVEMRASDHQLQQPLFISSWAKVGGPLRHDVEKTGFTWKTERAIDSFVAATPTSCNMQRPAKP